jgi:hypothetical protein
VGSCFLKNAYRRNSLDILNTSVRLEYLLQKCVGKGMVATLEDTIAIPDRLVGFESVPCRPTHELEGYVQYQLDVVPILSRPFFRGCC